MNKQLANEVLATLENTAGSIERLRAAKRIDPRVAAGLVRDIDAFADKFHIATYGEKSLLAYRAKMAKVIKKDKDEKYMNDAFENTQKPRKTEPDEPYMHKTEKSFNCDAIPTYDSDRSSSVSEERKEHAIRDLSEHADKTARQPSWNSGPAGKSTRQGSTQKTEKTWAP